MPKFELIPLQDALSKTATGKRALIAQEYLGYITQLERGKAGRLESTEGESITAIRRRLGKAAKQAGREIIIKRAGEQIYFWVNAKKRGRPRKNPLPQ